MLSTKQSLIILATTVLILASTCHANQLECAAKGTENSINIKMALNECIPSSQVDVHVNNDVIQFAGFVDDRHQYGAVQNLANKYIGEYRVINNVKILSVKDDRHDEIRLRDDVKRQLQDYKYPVENIDVQARNGHVILSGFVNKHISLRDIEKISKSVPGVKEVDNYLLYKQALS